MFNKVFLIKLNQIMYYKLLLFKYIRFSIHCETIYVIRLRYADLQRNGCWTQGNLTHISFWVISFRMQQICKPVLPIIFNLSVPIWSEFFVKKTTRNLYVFFVALFDTRMSIRWTLYLLTSQRYRQSNMIVWMIQNRGLITYT